MQPRLDDPAWLTAQYDNRARIADHPAVFARWARASAAAMSGSVMQADIAYGAGPGETLDVYPAPHPGAPVLVFIHGGYWRSLDKHDVAFVAPALVAAGATVVLPNHALCPAVTVEHIALQMARAVAWVWRNADRINGDPRRIAIAGHSAGGHLVAMLHCCAWKRLADDLPQQPLAGGLSISGLYDLEPIRNAPFLQADLQLTPAAVKRLSPAFFPRPKGARLQAVVGGDESDEFIRQTRLIRDVWGPTAVPVCETIAGAHHLNVVEGLAEPSARVHQLALRLLGLA